MIYPDIKILFLLRNLRIQKHVVNEHYAAADCAEIYKKASGLLLIELGPRVIKKPYAFLDTAGKKNIGHSLFLCRAYPNLNGLAN